MDQRWEALGAFIRDHRENAELSLRKMADLTGVSNPYLSQIERGLRKPSAEILQQIAKALEISAENLYVRAGWLDDESTGAAPADNVISAIEADQVLSEEQRRTLIHIYHSFIDD